MKYRRRKRGTLFMSLLVALSVAAINPACAEKGAPEKNVQTETTSSTQTTEQQNPDAAAGSSASGAHEQQPEQNETAAAAADKEAVAKVDVYLFHGTHRCYSCNLMEEMTIEAIDEKLAREKKNGKVAFRHVNVEEDGNRHFIDDYNIRAISIILSRKSGGKEQQWKNLDKVWMLLRNREKFKEYVVKEIRDYLKG